MADEPQNGETGAHSEVPKDAAFPPFDSTTFTSQLFWLALTFVFLYVMMARVALPRVASVLEERRERIADDRDKAEQLQGEAAAAVTAYETALAEARARAHAIAAENRARVNEEIEALKTETEAELQLKLSEAESRIGAMKETALAKVRDVAAEALVDVVTRLLDQPIDLATAGRYVDAELAARASDGGRG